MNQEKIWDYFQVEAVDNFDDSVPRLNYLFKQALRLSQGRKIRVLNIGVGNGWLERRCAEQGFETHALDPSAVTIEALSSEGIAARVGTIDELPYPDDHFDTVFCSEVLEHLDDPTLSSGLNEIARVLKPGGHLIGTVPFDEDLSTGRVVCPDCGKVFHRWGHQRSFNKDTLTSALGSADLGIVTLKTYAFADYSKKVPLNHLRQWLRWILGRLGSRHVYSNLYFVAGK